MNIKGKHLKLCRYVRDNYGVEVEQVIAQGFEASMITSLQNKGILAASNEHGRLYATKETQNKIQ